MKTVVFWLLQVLAVVIAVMGGQEVGLYGKRSEQLIELKSKLIHELETQGSDFKKIEAVRSRIEYIETSDYFDRSLYKGIGMCAVGLGLSVLIARYRNKERANQRLEDNAGLPPPSGEKSTAVEHRLPGAPQP